MEACNTVKLAQELVKIKSITPDDNGCQDLIINLLEPNNFKCLTVTDSGVTNLLAFHGSGSPFTLFLGHTDVVPTGNESSWDHLPFSGEIITYEDGDYLYGRGSSDMKGGDAAMITAMLNFTAKYPKHKGTVGLLLTSNEEGDSIGGTPFMVEYLKSQQLIPDYCLIAECSCDEFFGDSIKNGRRGDMNATITVHGIQGHVALSQFAKNAVHLASRLIVALEDHPIDHGTDFFPPTSFQVSNIKGGTGADNVVPGSCTIRCNFRWNDLQDLKKIKTWVQTHADRLGIKCDLDFRAEGDPFLTKEGPLIDALKASIKETLNVTPKLGTSGGTSDGRFIRPLGTQTLEFGPVSSRIHQVNERVKVEDLKNLAIIFEKTLEKLY